MKEKILRRIRNELRFTIWGFSTTRMAFVTDVLNVIFCFSVLTIQDHYRLHYSFSNECGPIAGMLFLNALLFCFLPPYSWLKLNVCWPLTGATFIPIMMLPALS